MPDDCVDLKDVHLESLKDVVKVWKFHHDDLSVMDRVALSMNKLVSHFFRDVHGHSAKLSGAICHQLVRFHCNFIT